MPIQITCVNPSCRKPLQIQDRYAGQKVRCPACKQEMKVPAALAPPRPSRPATPAPLSPARPSPPRPAAVATPATLPAPAPSAPRRGSWAGRVLSAAAWMILGAVPAALLVWWALSGPTTDTPGRGDAAARQDQQPPDRLREPADPRPEPAEPRKVEIPAGLAEAGEQAGLDRATVADLQKLLAGSAGAGDVPAAVALLARRLQLMPPPPDLYYLVDRYALHTPAAAEKSVESLAEYLSRPAVNDLEKVRAFYRWIVDRIDYDAEAVRQKRSENVGAEETLRRRQATCSGYANLFQKLCELSGVESQVVYGFVKGYGYRPGAEVGEANHAWNAVKLDGRWRLVDPTWGAGTFRGPDYVRRPNEFYFLAAPDEMIYTHFPEEARWQLLDRPVTAAEFAKLTTLDRQAFRAPGLLRQTLGEFDKGFRGFVEYYDHPGEVWVFEAPVEYHLHAGRQYKFRVASADFDTVVVKNEAQVTRLEKSADTFHGEVTARPGELLVAGRSADGKSNYSVILGYVVD